MGRSTTRGTMMVRRTTLALALLGAYGYMPLSVAVNLTIENDYDLGGSSMSNSTVTVNNGGVATGDGTSISGSAYDVVLINSGGSLTLSNATISNNLDHPTGTNGRAVAAKGVDATASLTDSTITISAHSTNTGTDYSHAFTAGVGAADGGHVDIQGGSITASGSKRTVGIQANDGGSIRASAVQITTNDHFGHAVQAYRTLTASEMDTHVDLNGVSITTNGSSYSLGIQSANKGASVTATDTDITTKGTVSFGVEVLNGATAALTNGSITTQGEGAAGVRVYGGDLGSGHATINGTRIQTSGRGASGVLAGDSAEPRSGIVHLSDADIVTIGNDAAGLQSAHGSSIESTRSSLYTQGGSSHGVYVHDGGSVSLSGDSVITDGLQSYGLVAAGGDATSDAGMINASGVSVVTRGSDSVGVLAGAKVGNVITKGTINLDNSSINAQGNSAAAAVVQYGSTLTSSSSTLSSQKGDGIVMTDNATVRLTGTRVDAAGASLVSNLNSAGQHQNIAIGSGSTLIKNNGTLLQVTRTDAGMDGIVTLTLEAGSNSRGDVIDLDGLSAGNDIRSQGGKTNFNIEKGASWVGIIRGINDATTADGGSFIDNGGAPITGNVTGGENSTIVFNKGATIAGGLSIDTGSQGTFKGKTSIGGSLVGVGSSLTFNGATNIGQSVTGDGTSFQFSTNAPTAIGGNVELNQGSSLKGGTVTAPITISGDTSVNSGSVLGGNLIVQGALSGKGGTLSPGNSVGAQSYATSAGFSGTYAVEVNGAGESDLIVIRNGNFDLAGIDLIVTQENGNGGYLLNHAYTIVQTEQGDVVNQFASEALDPDSFANARVKLDPVRYGRKDVKISLSPDAARIDSSDWSSNQRAAYQGVVSAGSGNPLAFSVLASADMKAALNQLSGELHGSTQSALLNAGDLTARTLSNRMRGNIHTRMVADGAAAQGSDSLAGIISSLSAYPLWAQVVGNWSTLDGDENSARTKTRTGGIFVGGDTVFGNGWRAGAALGFTDGRVEVNGRASKADVTSYTAAIYGGNSWAAYGGHVNFLGGAAYTHHNIDSRRTVTVGGNQALKADYNVNASQLFTELGYSFDVGQASTMEPYLGVAWLSQRAAGFNERGGTAALKGQSQHDGVITMTLGLRGAMMLDMGNQQAILKGGIGWRHAAGDIEPNRRMSFIQGEGASFKVAGAPIAANAAVLDLGTEMSIGKNTALGLSYTGQLGDGSTDHNGNLYLRVRFK